MCQDDENYDESLFRLKRLLLQIEWMELATQPKLLLYRKNFRWINSPDVFPAKDDGEDGVVGTFPPSSASEIA